MSSSTHVHHKSRLTILAVALLSGLFVGFGATAAYAGTAYSAWGYYTVNSVNYRNQAVIITNPTTNAAGSNTYLGGTNTAVPSGWGGNRARTFNSSNVMLCQTGILYNSGTLAAGGYYSNSCGVTAVGAFYGYGVTWGWTGSSYSARYTFKSPNQNT